MLTRGWSAALPGYTLALATSLTQIVQEIRSSLDWLAAEGGTHGEKRGIQLTCDTVQVMLSALPLFVVRCRRAIDLRTMSVYSLQN